MAEVTVTVSQRRIRGGVAILPGMIYSKEMAA
jgi:hypothetical protein